MQKDEFTTITKKKNKQTAFIRGLQQMHFKNVLQGLNDVRGVPQINT